MLAWSEKAKFADMDHVSPNHANALLVGNHPPIPTVSPSASVSGS